MGGQSPGTLGQNDCMRDRADDFGHAKGLPPQVQRLGLEKDIYSVGKYARWILYKVQQLIENQPQNHATFI